MVVKMYKNLLGVILMFFMNSQPSEEVYLNEINQTFNTITQYTGNQIESEIKHIEFCGIGGAIDKNRVIVQKSLTFKVKRHLDRDEGVRVIAKIIDKYLENIQANKMIISYLEKYPFNYKNLEISLLMEDERGNDFYYPNFSFISIERGIMSYTTRHKSEKFRFGTLSDTDEPFEEAAKRVGVWDTLRH